MPNPNNITLRSEKGSFLTFEEMDLSLLETRDFMNEYVAFVNNQYTNLNNDFNALQTDYNQYKISNDADITTLYQQISDFNDEQSVQNSRITQNEYDIAEIKTYIGMP